MYTQGWSLRRMISLFNSIVRRGHVPREEAIQRLMESVGLVVTPNTEDQPNAAEDEISDDLSEAAESSVCTHDEAVDVPGYLANKHFTACTLDRTICNINPTSR